jgi:hypothetical protein
VLASGAEPGRDALVFFRGSFCQSPLERTLRPSGAATP